MDLVGYDLYCKILSEAVREEKGEAPEESFETVVDLTMDAYIPDSYIPNEFQKMEFYKKIAAIENEDDYNDVADELMDRCGEMPKPVTNLLAIADLKAAAHAASFMEIKERGGARAHYREPGRYDHGASLAEGGLFPVSRRYKARSNGEESENIRIKACGDKENIVL